ncbi:MULTISPECIES: hypothetical protein [unclassified Nostoc]|uniref:hypothetical protein n=1 Tax=unclassified Nostoc TaxID=2593658 RepID=UPI001CB8B596|nr:hypothetical protein [Nostoc sp. 'Peltigera membranacea cyanobiont' 213]
MARRFGATDVVSSRGEEAIAAVKEMTQGGAESVLECVGSEPEWQKRSALRVLVERSGMLACRPVYAERVKICSTT